MSYPCMVCGKPTTLCVPLTFCDECKDSKRAEIIRERHREYIRQAIASRKAPLDDECGFEDVIDERTGLVERKWKPNEELKK